MAGFRLLGGPEAVYLVVPLLGSLCIGAAAWLGARMSSPGAGAIAALLLAASPTFLFAVMWPMSDVPAAGWWALALALATGGGMASAMGAGAAAGLAVLTRPNLVLVAVAPALYLTWRAARDGSRGGWQRLLGYCALTALGCLGVAAVHTWLYGSPLQTGYGHVSAVYSAAESATILTGFATRPAAVEPAMVVLGLAGLLTLWRHIGEQGRVAWLSAGTAGLVLLSYTFYVWFSDWWYLRLLLPAGPALAALGGAGAMRLTRLAPARLRGLVLALVAAAIVIAGLRNAVDKRVFEVRKAEARYQAVARFVADVLPPNAAFLAFQQSGGLRYYTGRPILRFDVLLPEWFDTAISKLRSRGYRPYFVVEDHDILEFKRRFRPVSPLGYLDWPAVAELDGPVRVWIFDPADRGKALEGQRIVTHRIVP
jgi:hypothetical protein